MRRLALLLAALTLGAGCGDGDSGREVRHLNAPPVISQSQVERYPAGSPERVLFEWMRAVAFSDAPSALKLQDPSLPITALGLARRREAVEVIVEKMRDPRISDVRRNGKTVTMIGSVGSTDPKVARLSHRFRLERLKGEWKIMNPPFGLKKKS